MVFHKMDEEKELENEQEGNQESGVADHLDIIPLMGETNIMGKLEKYFGEDKARDIARMLQVIALRKIHSVISFAEYFLGKLDIAGIRTRVGIERHLGSFSYEVTIRLYVEDVDPVMIKKNMRELYRMAKFSRDEEKLITQLENYVWAIIRSEATKDEE
jgi:hypothetical protein